MAKVATLKAQIRSAQAKANAAQTVSAARAWQDKADALRYVLKNTVTLGFSIRNGPSVPLQGGVAVR